MLSFSPLCVDASAVSASLTLLSVPWTCACACLADPWYQRVGRTLLQDLNRRTRVRGGYASVRDITTGQLEDHQHSFFLAET